MSDVRDADNAGWRQAMIDHVPPGGLGIGPRIDTAKVLDQRATPERRWSITIEAPGYLFKVMDSGDVTTVGIDRAIEALQALRAYAKPVHGTEGKP